MTGVLLSTSHCELEPCLVGNWERGIGITAGWGETEVFMEVSSRRLAIVQHCHLPAHGLLSLLSLLSAFLLTGTKRNQTKKYHGSHAVHRGIINISCQHASN